MDGALSFEHVFSRFRATRRGTQGRSLAGRAFPGGAWERGVNPLHKPETGKISPICSFAPVALRSKSQTIDRYGLFRSGLEYSFRS